MLAPEPILPGCNGAVPGLSCSVAAVPEVPWDPRGLVSAFVKRWPCRQPLARGGTLWDGTGTWGHGDVPEGVPRGAAQ